MKRQSYQVLIVDPEKEEQFFVGSAFRKALGSRGTAHVVRDGEEATEYMMGEGKYSDRKKHPFPSLVVMELNMPRGDAFDLLEFMHHNPAWNVVPRIVFASSDEDEDIRIAYAVGATAYHRKPDTVPALERIAQLIIDYWVACEVPPMDESGRLTFSSNRERLKSRYPHPVGGRKMERVPKK